MCGFRKKSLSLQGLQGVSLSLKKRGFRSACCRSNDFGKPCFISSLTSLPEIGGDAAYYFTELNPRSMAADVMEGMKDYENDPEAKRRHILAHVRKFDWDKAASAYIDFYLEILGCR